jgi:hypothetical protein
MLLNFSSASVTGLNNNAYQISRGQVMSSCFFVFFFFFNFFVGSHNILLQVEKKNETATMAK